MEQNKLNSDDLHKAMEEEGIRGNIQVSNIGNHSHTECFTLLAKASPPPAQLNTNKYVNNTIKFGKAILITECIQEDLIGRISSADPLPSSLHIGLEEARRLLGEDPWVGQFARLMRWARSQNPEDIEIIHVRFWNDSNDPDHQELLSKFGKFCMKNSPGADLVLGFGNDVLKNKNEQFLNTKGFNDFEGTDLASTIQRIVDKSGDLPIRVGIVGVWTEAKISFLLYELKTRFRINNLGTCSALTAGFTRLQHFNALNMINNLFGVTVANSVGEFTDWLLPDGKRFSDIKLTTNPIQQIKLIGINEEQLLPEDRRLLTFLFRTCSSVKLHQLAGGFSGALVFKAQGVDSLGHKLASCVVKLGPRSLISKELYNFERVEEILGNNAPRVKGYVDLNERAGIKFSYASMSDETVQTFESMYKLNVNQVRINQILCFIFEEILGRFYAVSQWENIKLFDCYNFDGKGWAWNKGGTDNPTKVRERITEILGVDGSQPELEFPGGLKVRNIAEFLERELPNFPRREHERHFVSYVHGDLQGGNILLDPNENIWLIDFFFTERTHVLKDIAKVENDILYLFTNPEDEQDIVQGLRIISTLAQVNDLGVPLVEKIPGLVSPAIIKAWESIRTLRHITKTIVKQERNPLQMSIVLLRYALHNLCLDTISRNQKVLALAAACIHAECIKAEYEREMGPLKVFWIPKEELKTQGRLGITLLPGRIDKGRELIPDLLTLQSYGVKRLVCLSQNSELEYSQVTNLADEANKLDIKYLASPLKDQGIPSPSRLYETLHWIVDGLTSGEDVVLCCNAGLGRSGLFAACTLVVVEGMKAERAIELIKKVRETTRAIERKAQENFVHYFLKFDIPRTKGGVGRPSSSPMAYRTLPKAYKLSSGSINGDDTSPSSSPPSSSGLIMPTSPTRSIPFSK